MAKKPSKKAHDNKLELKLRKVDKEQSIDPSLQDIILTEQHGPVVTDVADRPHHDPEICDGKVVDVIVRLENLPALLADGAFRKGALPAGLALVGPPEEIMTGTATIKGLLAIRKHPAIRSLKATKRIHRDLDRSLEELSLSRGLMADQGFGDIDGRGVLVGIVDYGCDFAHPKILDANGETRVLYLWDQGDPGAASSPTPWGYGREYSKREMDDVIEGHGPSDLRQYLDSVPRGAHGTHVMDIACGGPLEGQFSGVASAAGVIFVQVAPRVGPETNFGNSGRLLEAVRYIFAKADELGRPCVVNISLGTHGGPKDGSNLVEIEFDRLLASERGRAIVIAAGNATGDRSHAHGVLDPGAVKSFDWEIRASDTTLNELEIWYHGHAPIGFVLEDPGGNRFGPINPDSAGDLVLNGSVLGRIIHRRGDPNNGDSQIDVFLSPQLPSGVWRVHLEAGDEPVEWHGWVERDDRGQSRLGRRDADERFTLGSIACGRYTIAVAAYRSRDVAKRISAFSSSGPTRDGRMKPEVSAPGDPIVAASANTAGLISMSGTSMAAPHVTGVVALAFQAVGHSISIRETRRLVLSGSVPPAQDLEWDDAGHGRLDALASILSIESLLPQQRWRLEAIRQRIGVWGGAPVPPLWGGGAPVPPLWNAGGPVPPLWNAGGPVLPLWSKGEPVPPLWSHGEPVPPLSASREPWGGGVASTQPDDADNVSGTAFRSEGLGSVEQQLGSESRSSSQSSGEPQTEQLAERLRKVERLLELTLNLFRRR